MCLLHDQEEYGVARWPLKEIAGAVGVSTTKLQSLVTKGILKGADAGKICATYIFTPTGAGRKKGNPVELIAAQPGPLWYSSRMVLDEYKRMVRASNESSPNNAPNPPIGAAPKVAPDPAPSRAGASSSSTSTKHPINLPANAGEPEKFPMHIGWQPSDHVAGLAKQSGTPLLDSDLPEFMAHWLTQPITQRTQAEWDKALLQSAKHRELRAKSPLPARGKPTPKPENFAEKDYGSGIRPL